MAKLKLQPCPKGCTAHRPTPTRMVIWEGPSQIDGSPLVVLATGVPVRPGRGGKSSANSKTGDMVQIVILRSDIDPMTALREGKDTAICGVCPHKSRAAGGTGACYVQVGKGPLTTWRSHWAHGSTPFDIERLRGRKIRFGAYGDPAAVPFEVWSAIAAVADGVTGYTHQWQADRLAAAGFNPAAADPRLAEFCMASADTPAEGVAARRLGFRSFIVRGPGEARPKGAVVCPASAEAGKRTVCATCMSCGGTGNGRRNDVTIIAHGATAGSFRPLPLAVV